MIGKLGGKRIPRVPEVVKRQGKIFRDTSATARREKANPRER